MQCTKRRARLATVAHVPLTRAKALLGGQVSFTPAYNHMGNYSLVHMGEKAHPFETGKKWPSNGKMSYTTFTWQALRQMLYFLPFVIFVTFAQSRAIFYKEKIWRKVH